MKFFIKFGHFPCSHYFPVAQIFQAISQCFFHPMWRLKKYDGSYAKANQYIYNLKTSDLSVGTWKATVRFDDGSQQSVLFGLK